MQTAEEQYLDVMRELLGVFEATQAATPDRTGTGRVRLFGRDIRMDLSDGSLPVITTRKINYEHAIYELLWMISGSSNIKDLNDKAKPIWSSWAVKESDIDAFIDKFFPKDTNKPSGPLKLVAKENIPLEGPLPLHEGKVVLKNDDCVGLTMNDVVAENGFYSYQEDLKTKTYKLTRCEYTAAEFDASARNMLKSEMMEKHLGSIGPMYGQFWRNNVDITETMFYPYETITLDDIPSDKVKLFGEMYDENVWATKKVSQAQGIDTDSAEFLDSMPSKELFIKNSYFKAHDQLGDIIIGIKKNPYSARHCMSAWIPQFKPFEKVYSPIENVLIGRGALTACHVFTQFFVEQATDGGADFLSARMFQRSCDWALGVCTNLVFYALLTHLVAHCTGLRVKEFIWSGGDVHLYGDHLELAKEQVGRIPFAPPKVRFNPEAKDLFKITREDITIEGYEFQDSLKYKVSV